MRYLFLIAILSATHNLWSQHFSGDALRAVNSSYDEQNPVLSPDGQTLFFTVGNHPANAGGKKDPGDIWFSLLEGNAWSAPQHGGATLNDRAYNAVAGFSADGSQLFLHGHYGSAGALARTQGISFARRGSAGWSHPENISIPYFLNKSGSLSGMLSADNAVFVFSADSYGTHGVDDIYVTVRHQGNWSEPRNLGASINTQFQELSPSLSEDMRTLYFSSNGRKGSGSFDIYQATRLDDTWTSWSAPINMGSEINSEGRELYYRPYGAQGFALYTSTTSSDGYGDMKVSAVTPPPPVDTSVFASISPERKSQIDPAPPLETVVVPVLADAPSGKGGNAEADGRITVYGKIVNARTGEPVMARVTFESAGGANVQTMAGADGYSVPLPSADYAVKIEASNFISTLEKLDIGAFEMPGLEMNFSLRPVEVGTTVNLKNVLFAQAKTEILPESFSELDLVVSFLKENPKVRIELMGHTDGRGVHADNVRLSQERVNRVKEYLVSRGIESRRISGKGFGGSKPIASNDTEESRRMNRRVEFVIRRF